MALDDLDLTVDGPDADPDDEGPAGTLVDDASDPIAFLDDRTPDAGQPDGQGVPDAGVQTAPGADPTTDAQAPPEPSGDTPPTPWEGQHPDKLDLASMTNEQYVEWASAHPDAARRYAMRQDDYSRKTEERARREEELDKREQQLAALETQLREQQQSGVQPQQGPQQAGDLDGDLAFMQQHGMEMYNQLREKLGREPNYVEFSSYSASVAARTQAQQVVQPLATRVDETASQFAQRQQQILASRLKAESEALVEAIPQAADPSRLDQIGQFLQRNPAMLDEPGCVRMAYNALFADADARALAQGRGYARQQQAEASRTTPGVPPSGQDAPATGVPADMDAAYNLFRQQAARGTLLDTFKP